MTEYEKLVRRYNRRAGVLKGLITRYKNAGYDIESTYTRPKRITEGSIRRVEKEIHEITRQKDVQEVRISIAVKQKISSLKCKVRGYESGALIGHVGRDNRRGVYKEGGKGHRLTIQNAATLITELDEAQAAAGKDANKLKKLLNNLNENSAALDEYVEEYTLAVYNETYAVWGGGFDRFSAALEAFKFVLFEGVKEGW